MKAKKGSSLWRQKRERGRRVSRNAGENVAINGKCTIGRKRIAVNCKSCEYSAKFCQEREKGLMQINSADGNSYYASPLKCLSPLIGKEENLARETDFDALPLDIIVQIVCNFHHDELKPLFHVSSKFREAVKVVIARRMHFNYTTPVRVKAPKRGAYSLMPDESSDNFSSELGGLECFIVYQNGLQHLMHQSKRANFKNHS